MKSARVLLFFILVVWTACSLSVFADDETPSEEAVEGEESLEPELVGQEDADESEDSPEESGD